MINKDKMSYTLEEINDAVKNGIPISKDINKISCTLEEIKAINKAPLYNWDDSDAAYQSAVNAALENARKATKAADAAWGDYEDTLNSPDRGIWEVARDAYDVAYDVACDAWDDYENTLNHPDRGIWEVAYDAAADAWDIVCRVVNRKIGK